MRNSILSFSLFPSLAIAIAVATGCGGGTPEPASPTTPAPTASAATGPAPTAPEAALPTVWSKDMTKEQQVAFMKKNIVGPMAKVFQGGHDGAKFADFSCKTCHGPEYKNPKDFLPKLTFKDGKITAFAEKPDDAKFMASAVNPAMAQAMGLKPYDPATHEGFGCGGCHTIDMK